MRSIFEITPPHNERLRSYYNSHISLFPHLDQQVLEFLIQKLQQKRHDIGLSIGEVVEIVHNKKEVGGVRISCMNLAILNKNKRLAENVLEYEKIFHDNNTESVLSCIRENCKDEPLKLQLVAKIRAESSSKCLGNIVEKVKSKLSCCKDNNTVEAVKSYLSCHRKNNELHDTYKKSCFEIMKIVISVLFHTLLVSILPVAWDLSSDIQLGIDYKDYNASNSKENLMKFGCNTSDSSMDLTKEYDLASWLTFSILVLNGIMYAIGVYLVPTTHLDNSIIRMKVRYDTSYCEVIIILLVLAILYMLKILAKLLWPTILLMTYQIKNQVTPTPTRSIQDKFKTENLWNMVKVLETSFENILQLAIQLWVLIPIYGCISQKSWPDLLFAGRNGVLNIISFGRYESESDVDNSLGKILFTVIMLSFTHAMKKLEKPGLGFLEKIKLLVLLLFPSVILQVVARILVITNLMLMTVPGWYKYTCFLLFHFLGILGVKFMFETKMTQATSSEEKIGIFEWLPQKVYSKRRVFKVIISCLCSSFLQVNIHHASSTIHQPKHTCLSASLFYMLIFIENIVMTLLPFTTFAPTLFPPQDEFNYSSFVTIAIFVNLSWIFVVIIEVIYVYKYFLSLIKYKFFFIIFKIFPEIKYLKKDMTNI